MNFKKNNYLVLFITSLLVLVPSLLILITDPFHFIFPKSDLELRSLFVSKNQRYQSATRTQDPSIKNWLVGTSMTENFDTKYLFKNFKNKYVRISISGLRPNELQLVLKRIIKFSQPKHIIIDLHWYFAIKDKTSNLLQKDPSFPYYMYDQNILNDFQYLFDFIVLKSSINFYIRKKELFQKGVHRINNWMNQSKFNIYKKPEEKLKLQNKISKYFQKLDIVRAPEKTQSIANLLTLLKKYENIKFTVFIPPYSTSFYKSHKDRSLINRLLNIQKYFVLHKSKNVDFYGFNHKKTIVNNLLNYKDYGHYSERINEKIINMILRQDGKLEKETIDLYLLKVINNINSYQIE